MVTKVLNSELKEDIKIAAEILKNGGTVVIPTETVYGLSANALDKDAILKIFKAKGRPSDNPLIVHLAKKEDVELLTDNISERASILMDRFWPGPLTMIFPKNNKVPYEITAGLDTVAIRVPESAEALAVIKEAGLPLAAPSANISGKPSPTRKEHVLEDMMGKVDAILCGPDCVHGLESTVLDVYSDPPVILRPGMITKEDIEETLNCKVLLKDEISSDEASDYIPVSPGMKYAHYAPNAPVILFSGDGSKVAAAILNRYNEEISLSPNKKVGIISTSESKEIYLKMKIKNPDDIKEVGSRENALLIANRLFDLLRTFDKENYDLILSETFEREGVGTALMNRLVKSSGNNIVHIE